MKLYICSNSKSLMDDIDGVYYLIAEDGNCLASHFCSCKYCAKGDLYIGRPERIKKYTEQYGQCECLYLGEDDMTTERLLKLNKTYFEERQNELEE